MLGNLPAGQLYPDLLRGTVWNYLNEAVLRKLLHDHLADGGNEQALLLVVLIRQHTEREFSRHDAHQQQKTMPH